MNSYEKYYTESLYPFQDGILAIVKQSGTPFYLTGGTALSRHYYNHRYSDDIDLFVNSDPMYPDYVQRLFLTFEETQAKGFFKIDYTRIHKTEFYTQLYLTDKNSDEIVLKLDIINDIAAHYGDIEESAILGRIDSWRNILSNKIAALFRYEAKDFADLYIISKKVHFLWRDIIEEAKTKEIGVDPLALYQILKSFPPEVLDSIKWTTPVDAGEFCSCLAQIADDILNGRANSLCIP